MSDRLDILLNQIRKLESDLVHELQKKEREFLYKVRQRKVRFEAEAKARHREFIKHIYRYILDSKLLICVTAPFLWICLLIDER